MTSSLLRLLLVATWCLLSSTFVAADVTVVGSTYATTRQHATASISVPAEARSGDLLVVFIGGSGRPFRDEYPSGPLPSSGWKEIIRFGPKDISQKAYYKVYGEDRSTYDINQGKSIFATMLAMRGADATAPIVDVAADGIDTIPEIGGGSRAPAVMSEEGGLGIFSFAFDDPLRSIALNTPGASMITSFKAVSGDGMAVFSSSNKNADGTVGPINVKGTFTWGAGNEVAISMSIRPEMPRGKSTRSEEVISMSILPEMPRGRSSLSPSSEPSSDPSSQPSSSPSSEPSSDPSSQPSSSPSSEPTFSPSHVPSASPSFEPTTCVAAGGKCELDEDGAAVAPCCSSDLTCFMFPGLGGRCIATNEPTLSPTVTESSEPSSDPSSQPSSSPSSEPTFSPSHVPSASPSFEPTTCVAAGGKCELDEDGAPVMPCCSSDLTCFMFHGVGGRCITTNEPTLSPTVAESESPSASPSAAPVEPTSEPSSAPSFSLSDYPTIELVRDESPMPTAVPTQYPRYIPPLRRTLTTTGSASAGNAAAGDTVVAGQPDPAETTSRDE